MKGKNIVIIGGNSGVGKSVAELALDIGANLYLYSRSGEGNHQIDVTDGFSELQDLPEVIDGLVYCPGSINLKPFHRISMEDFKSKWILTFLERSKRFMLV
ncbi:hypothetical protein [Algoriphagus sp. Y33]|uniref:hypothetical protein n=1 Tax=Algoriphagus sp. Y33 TaxID=2772483 RepID=UPI00351C2816